MRSTGSVLMTTTPRSLSASQLAARVRVIAAGSAHGPGAGFVASALGAKTGPVASAGCVSEAGEAAAEADAEERRAARCHLKTVQRREMRQEQRWTKEQAMQAALDQLVAMEVDMEDLRMERARLAEDLELCRREVERNALAFAAAVRDVNALFTSVSQSVPWDEEDEDEGCM